MFTSNLLAIGFIQPKSYYSLFTRMGGNPFVAILVYADGILVASSDIAALESFKPSLNSQFKLIDLGRDGIFLAWKLQDPIVVFHISMEVCSRINFGH